MPRINVFTFFSIRLTGLDEYIHVGIWQQVLKEEIGMMTHIFSMWWDDFMGKKSRLSCYRIQFEGL
jgi:hypothetical protein